MGDRGRVPALDGLRGVAVLAVMAQHAGWPRENLAGVAGVTLFFVLSGYLITGVLQRDQAPGWARRFYLRRTVRLVPALIVCVAVTAALAARLPWVTDVPTAALLALTYTQNVATAHFGADPAGLYAHTWSLAMEEQFYLVWPALLVLARHRALRLLGGLAVASLILRGLWVGDAAWTAYTSPLTAALPLFAGCALALRPIRTSAWPWLALLTGTVVLPSTVTGAALAVIPATVASVGLVAHAASDPRWLRARPLLWVGRRSYGIYLWHWPLLVIVALPWSQRGLIAYPLAIGAAALSWRWVEQPLLLRASGPRRVVEQSQLEPDQRVVFPGQHPNLRRDLSIGRTGQRQIRSVDG